jgi:hypothetical protein
MLSSSFSNSQEVNSGRLGKPRARIGFSHRVLLKVLSYLMCTLSLFFHLAYLVPCLALPLFGPRRGQFRHQTKGQGSHRIITSRAIRRILALIQINSPFPRLLFIDRVWRDAMSDFCYSRPMLERIFRHAELMDRMMDRLGIDVAAAARLDGGMAWYEARTMCIGCCRERQCADWVTRSEVGTASEPQFCCDAEFFRRLRAKGLKPSDRSFEFPSRAAPRGIRGGRRETIVEP